MSTSDKLNSIIFVNNITKLNAENLNKLANNDKILADEIDNTNQTLKDHLAKYTETEHAHANKAALDTITQAKVDSWDSKQDKIDNTLNTTDKTIPGAINELRSSLDNILNQNLNYDGFLSVKDFGAKGDGITDDTQAFKDWIIHIKQNNIKKAIVPYGEYIVSKSIAIDNIIGLEIVYLGKINAVASVTLYEVIWFINCENIIVRNLNVKTERKYPEEAPAGHTRKNLNGSNVIAIRVTGVKNLEVDGLITDGCAYDMFVLSSPGAGQSTTGVVNYNINIKNVYSRNCSMPFYVQQTDGFYLNGFDIEPAKEMGFGDHIVYLAKYAYNPKVTNGFITIPDSYFGYTIIARDGEVDDYGLSNPTNVVIKNVTCLGGGGFYSSKAMTKTSIIACDITCINPRNATGGYDAEYTVSNCKTFTTSQRANTVVSNCSIKSDSSLTVENQGHLRFQTCNIKTYNVLSSSFYTDYGTIEFCNSAIEITYNGLFLGVATNVLFENCKINCGKMYLIQANHTSTQGYVIFRNCDLQPDITGITQYFYNVAYSKIALINTNLKSGYPLTNNNFNLTMKDCTYNYDLSNLVNQ